MSIEIIAKEHIEYLNIISAKEDHTITLKTKLDEAQRLGNEFKAKAIFAMDDDVPHNDRHHQQDEDGCSHRQTDKSAIECLSHAEPNNRIRSRRLYRSPIQFSSDVITNSNVPRKKRIR